MKLPIELSPLPSSHPDWAVQAGGKDTTYGRGIANDGGGGALVTGYFYGEASFGSTVLTNGDTSVDAFVMHVTAAGVVDWAVQAGGTADSWGFGVAYDGAGGALVTGDFSGKASFGSTLLTSRGSSDVFVMHVTASGAIDWAFQAGGALFDSGNSIARVGGHDGVDGFLVSGSFSGEASFGSTSLISRGSDDAFVMHVTAAGAIDWVVQAGGMDSTYARCIANDGGGGALATGTFSGEASFGSTVLTSRGLPYAFVMHVTAAGAIDWAVQAGGTDYTYARSIANDGGGGALVTGYFFGEASFGSTVLTSGDTSADAFVMHVTAAGVVDWAVQAGGTADTLGSGVAYNRGSGGALVTGTFSGKASFGSTLLTSRGSSDVFVMHVTASGTIDWAIQGGGKLSDFGKSIAYVGAGAQDGVDASALQMTAQGEREPQASCEHEGWGKRFSGDQPYACDHDGCGKRFSDPSHLTAHIRSHTGERPFACDYEGCGKRFTQSSHLTTHIRTHTDDRPFACDHEGCGKRFSRSSHLTTHKRTHTGDQPYTCDHEGCGERFSRSDNLTRHKRTHTGERPYACDHEGCSERFSRSGHLTAHKRTHTGERPFACNHEGCGKRFSRSGSLKSHMRTS
eukprot:jgi/Chrpa1/12621/Chrysochromulina_OHIO_Genome00016292-RA